MTTDRLSKPTSAGFVSAYTADEWAQMARDKGHKSLAEAWEKAEREGWDAQHFSQTRRDQLEEKYPGAFKRFGLIGLPSYMAAG